MDNETYRARVAKGHVERMIQDADPGWKFLRGCLEKDLEAARTQLESCSVDDLGFVQGRVSELRRVLGLPASVLAEANQTLGDE